MKTASLWQNHNFRMLFSASAFTNLGDGILAVAFPWFATLLTRDPLLIGMVAGDVGNPFFGKLLKEIQRSALEKDHLVIVSASRGTPASPRRGG